MKKWLLLVLNIAAALSLFTFSTSASAQIGSLGADLVFTPVTPCRIMDTRNAGAASGMLTAGSTRPFLGWSGTFSAQGGANTSCGTLASTDEAVIVVNFTVVTPDAGGYITAFPADAPQPLAATVNFTAGAVVGNNATLKLNQTGTGGHFKIFSTANVHVVADVVGYYAKPVATALACFNTAISSNTIAANSISYTYASCSVGFTAVSATCDRFTPGVYSGGSGMASNNPASGVYCAWENTTASTQTVLTAATCCRIPGR